MLTDRGIFTCLLLRRLAISVIAIVATVQCVPMCSVGSLWRMCKETHSVPDLVDGGYNFGWQPYDQLRQMCRLKRHVSVLKCLHEELTSQCAERRDYITLLTIFNHKMYETAADYICEEHNVGIFEQNAECLRKFYPQVQDCGKVRSITATIQTADAKINRAINDSNERTQAIRTDKDSLLRFIQRTVEEQLCADRKIFVGCLERQFLRDKSTCIDAMVMLLTKYYSYLIPEWCRHPTFSAPYSSSSFQPMSDQRSPDSDVGLRQQLAQSSYSGVADGSGVGNGGGGGGSANVLKVLLTTSGAALVVLVVVVA